MGLYHFSVSHRFSRHFKKLTRGTAKIQTLLDEGKLITAEKQYNHLCMHYAECRILLSRKATEMEDKKVPASDAAVFLIEVRKEFLAFYALGDAFHVDITAQKNDALAYIDAAVSAFRAK